MTDTKRMVEVYLADPDMTATHPTTGVQVWLSISTDESEPLSELDFWMDYWGENFNDTDQTGKVCELGMYPTLETVVKLGGRERDPSWMMMEMTVEEVIHCLNQDKPQEGYGGD